MKKSQKNNSKPSQNKKVSKEDIDQMTSEFVANLNKNVADGESEPLLSDEEHKEILRKTFSEKEIKTFFGSN